MLLFSLSFFTLGLTLFLKKSKKKQALKEFVAGPTLLVRQELPCCTYYVQLFMKVRNSLLILVYSKFLLCRKNSVERVSANKKGVLRVSLNTP